MTRPASTRDVLVITRQFDIPVEVIWQMWTDPDEFSAWYGPKGSTILVENWDLRIGGARRVRMTVETPRGPMDMWLAGEPHAIVENAHLAYTEYVPDDDQGRPASLTEGRPDAHPVTEVRVDLADVGGATQMTLTHVGIPADSPGAVGWKMALDKLATHVREAG